MTAQQLAILPPILRGVANLITVMPVSREAYDSQDDDEGWVWE
jgi:hypothetical protein